MDCVHASVYIVAVIRSYRDNNSFLCAVAVILVSPYFLCVVIISCVLLQLFELFSGSVDDRREIVTAAAVPCCAVLCFLMLSYAVLFDQ